MQRLKPGVEDEKVSSSLGAQIKRVAEKSKTAVLLKIPSSRSHYGVTKKSAKKEISKEKRFKPIR
jgi:vacuolar-type H+-ATPase subunit F/Vma7